MKGFLTTIALSLLLTLQGNALEYARAVQRWPVTIPTTKIQDTALEEFIQSAAKPCGERVARNFERYIKSELPDGSCYGQSYVFMIANPPHARQLNLAKTPEEQKRMIWFQAKLAAMVYFNQKNSALMDRAVAIVREGYPGTLWSEEYIEKNLPELISRLRPKAQMQEKCAKLETDYAHFEKEMKFLDQLESMEQSILRGKKLCLMAEHKTSLNPQNPGQFRNAFQKKLKEISQSGEISDVIIGFNFDHNGQPSGHAILIQIKHLRVYDAMRGVYQYNSFEEMVADLPISQQKGCSYFQMLSFGRSP